MENHSTTKVYETKYLGQFWKTEEEDQYMKSIGIVPSVRNFVVDDTVVAREEVFPLEKFIAFCNKESIK